MKNEKLPKAQFNGELELGGFKITCAVLDNENHTRVLSERSLANALGVKGGGSHWQRKKRADDRSALLPEYVSQNYLQPFISEEIRKKLIAPIRYISKSNIKSNGALAEILPDICDIWIKAREAGVLNKAQEKTAVQAYNLLRGFAHVGIIALVDEATGFQEIRDKKALQKILDKYLLKEQAKWAKRFPDEFYQLMFELKGWQWEGMKVKRPGVVGTYTNDLVYSRLAPGVLSELRRLNPPDEITRRRKSKHHQWFTEDIGHSALQQHLFTLIAFMKASSNWSNFHRMVERAFPKLGETIPLQFEEDE